MGIFGESSSSKRKRKKERERQAFLSFLPIEEGEAAKSRIEAGKETKTRLFQQLGAPGTFDSAPGTQPAGSILDKTTTEVDAQNKVIGTKGGTKRGQKAYELWNEGFRYRGKYGEPFEKFLKKPRKGVLDPEGFTKATMKSPTSQIMSQMTAEAKQLLDEEGPLWDKFHQGVTNPILEASAQATRESLRQIKDRAAKGGTARRAALAEAQEMLAIESSNRLRAQQLWSANLDLRKYARRRATEQVFDNQNYVNGLVDPYVKSMNRAGEFLAKVSAPAASGMSSKAYQLANGPKNDFVEKLIIGGTTAAIGALTGGAGPAVAGAVGGFTKSAVGGLFGGEDEAPLAEQRGPGGGVVDFADVTTYGGSR